MPDSPGAPLILLVEDEADDRALYREHLVAAGFRVATASDGGEALEAARCEVPDLVVMDLEMPGMGGLQAARLLQGNGRTSGVPIVVLSGRCDTGSVMRAVVEGCTGFVSKPCLALELEDVIRSTLALESLSSREGPKGQA